MGFVYNLQSQTHVRKALRNSPTPGEEVLWKRLKGSKLGMKFRRQYGVGNYVVDFYCASARLAVELDGASHDDHAAKLYDAVRQKDIESLGIRVIRFSESEAVRHPEVVAERIRRIASSILA
ncbi:MAG: endonuclease domain-containing protein [Candidatus Uhrbacteria bacterium]|nr:endonuclease domain-containing protein [Candidatus Uhrbacteria bacterium]